MKVGLLSYFKTLGHRLIKTFNDISDVEGEQKLLFARINKFLEEFYFCSQLVDYITVGRLHNSW